MNNSRNDTIEIFITVTKKDSALSDQIIQSADKSITVSGKLPDGIQLVTKYLTAEDMEKRIRDTAFLKTHQLEQVIDLALFMDGEQYIPVSQLRVRMQLKPEWKDKKLSIIYIDAAGSITTMPCMVKDGFITFDTTHFSVYAIVSTKTEEDKKPEAPDNSQQPENQTPHTNQNTGRPNGTDTDASDVPTGDTTNILGLLTLLGASGLGIFMKKKKDHSSKRHDVE